MKNEKGKMKNERIKEEHEEKNHKPQSYTEED
jgi:hypothetical protein